MMNSGPDGLLYNGELIGDIKPVPCIMYCLNIVQVQVPDGSWRLSHIAPEYHPLYDKNMADIAEAEKAL